MNPLQQRRARVTVNVQREGATGLRALEYVFERNRMVIEVRNGGTQFNNAKVQIFGAPLEAMNNIARLWLEVLSPSNTDTLDIDVWDGAQFVPFFRGVITWSAINAGSIPAIALEIEANAAMALMNSPAAPYSSPDTPVKLPDVLSAILTPVGFTADVTDAVQQLQVTKQYLTGTPMDQIATLLNPYQGLVYTFDLQRCYVRTTQEALGGEPIRVDKYTGMIGYPTYATSGITLSMLFNPRVRLGVALDIRTEFDFVNRTKWVTSVLQHSLEPNKPGGNWMTQVAAAAYGPKGGDNGTSV
ncbi:hypothetical protein [Xanthomonas phage XPV1]|uniref:Uncharacterized protein n=1 Tax=Xanthomonas phage XPV1 TaxID=2099860 RepID=A0A3S7I698_9CAUD|nr:baseplate hub [Xanthomonas phage XPV1]AVO24194.1 hypothetical protein [Xanthomonas phage XPV1]